MFKSTTMAALLAVATLGLGACSGLNHQEQRALSGGAIGAGAGAAIGAITGGSAVTGALIGGAGGAAIGALTADDDQPRKRRR
ncbi:YMGG-like glycine zipper-containing protein [Zavarzinia compransoris]|nr:YMGG-like glycine zipper-containing protein [Zavarzinia compransoris]TDP46093.1 outer membrane protein with glycine zipper [Zavarzinia compransoris]